MPNWSQIFLQPLPIQFLHCYHGDLSNSATTTPTPAQHRPLFRMAKSRTISCPLDALLPGCDKLQAPPLKCPHTRLVNWPPPLPRSPPEQTPASLRHCSNGIPPHVSDISLIFWAHMLTTQDLSGLAREFGFSSKCSRKPPKDS